MLLIVQFPIVDGRKFHGIERRPKAHWVPNDGEFVPGFGAARKRREFKTVPERWRDDAHYVSARWALRVNGTVEKLDLGTIGVTPHQQFFWYYRPAEPQAEVGFAPAFRRLFSDGQGLARVEVGFWVFGRQAVEGENVLKVVRDALGLQVRVCHLNEASESGPLRGQGKALARMFYRATRNAPAKAPIDDQELRLVRAGLPAVFLDDWRGSRDWPGKPSWWGAMTKALGMPPVKGFPASARVVSPAWACGTKCAYTEASASGANVAVWVIRGARRASPATAGPVRNLRHCLPRLHAIRQAIQRLVSMAADGTIPYEKGTESAGSLDTYLDDLSGQVLVPQERREMATVAEIVAAYDESHWGEERAVLKQALAALPMKARRVVRLQSAGGTNAPQLHDVFLCHNSKDKEEVRQLGDRLRAIDVRPWFDEKSLFPDQQLQPQLGTILNSVPCVAVLIGPHGWGKTQEQEFLVAFERFKTQRRGLVVASLPKAIYPPDLSSLAVGAFPAIDLREWRLPDPSGFRALVTGIFGAAPEQVNGELNADRVRELREQMGSNVNRNPSPDPMIVPPSQEKPTAT